jgi:hypothetical protein
VESYATFPLRARTELNPGVPLMLNLLPSGVPEENTEGFDVCSHLLSGGPRAFFAIHPLNTELNAESMFTVTAVPPPSTPTFSVDLPSLRSSDTWTLWNLRCADSS